MTPEQALELYLVISDQSGVEKTITEFKQTYWVAQCPNPVHADHNPSCFVSANSPHGFSCKSCGFKGTLVGLARQFGIEFENKFSLSFRKSNSLQLPDLSLLRLDNWTDTYRGLTAEQWLKFGALKWFDTYVDKQTEMEVLSAIRLLLPIYHKGLLVSYTGRRIDDISLVKYNTYPGFPTSPVLYLYDMLPPTWPVVLVEGPFDAVKYWTYNIPALAILGCQNWSDSKLNLLLQKAPTTVWLSMDNDTAGQKAQVELYHKLSKWFNVKSITLPMGIDPFELAHELLLEVYNTVWSDYHQKISKESLVTS